MRKFASKGLCTVLAGTLLLGALTGCGKVESSNTVASSNDSHDFSLFGDGSDKDSDESDDDKKDTETSDSSLKDALLGKSDEEEDDKDADDDKSGVEFDETSRETKKKVDEIEKYIDKYFYFDEDDERREESYYDGIMKGLDDPYSVYYTKEEYERMLEDDSGEFEGIGATVAKNVEQGYIYIVKPIEGSPAEKSGLLPNDIIIAVDDLELTTDMELDYVVKQIRGEKGTDVVLKIYRDGEDDYIDVTITRDKIENKTVSYEMLDNNVGYIQVEQFIENTPKLFEEALDDLVAQGAEGIVIDMRNNPGGLLDSVIEMVDYIVEDDLKAKGASEAGILLQTKDKDDNILEEFKMSDGHSVDIPMAVLVNGNSASAAEIFSGCLKDYDVAEVVGTTTYGKGIVQSIIKLSDGSAIKLTIAQYFLPSGTAVHKVGVVPDKEVELDEALQNKVTIEHDEDNQLQEAIKSLGLE